LIQSLKFRCCIPRWRCWTPRVQ